MSITYRCCSLLIVSAFIFGCSTYRQIVRAPRIANEPIPSDVLPGMKTLAMDSIQIAIFPSSYLINEYYNDEHTELYKSEYRFTPSPKLIQDIDCNIVRQIFRADSIFIEQRMNDSTSGELLFGSRRKARLSDRLKTAAEDCRAFAEWDRQYVGYYNRAGNRMVLVHFVNVEFTPFREGFYHLFIAGCCDGPERFVRQYNYNIDKDSLSVN